ncbi:hypothetical protein [Streptomyces sp. NPDC002889]|uniref:hypothetical protein n=1 Tax=Streptomyces sp. NPDC002889 TaxID=3364669 RepID=UPI0036A2F1D1
MEFAPAWGVAGIVYDPKTFRPLPCDNDDGLTYVAYDDPRIRWTLAVGDAVVLQGCTTVDLDDLVACATA